MVRVANCPAVDLNELYTRLHHDEMGSVRCMESYPLVIHFEFRRLFKSLNSLQKDVYIQSNFRVFVYILQLTSRIDFLHCETLSRS